jgi:transcription termination factor NusB
MSTGLNDDTYIWHRTAAHYHDLQKALSEFLSSDLDRVKAIQAAIRNGEIAPALYVAQFMSESEKKCLFPQWVDLVSQAHRNIEAARKIIHSLPREWVLDNVESVAESILQDGTEDEYRRMLEMYRELDGDLTQRLARKATEHPDRDIQEAGFDFLES